MIGSSVYISFFGKDKLVQTKVVEEEQEYEVDNTCQSLRRKDGCVALEDCLEMFSCLQQWHIYIIILIIIYRVLNNTYLSSNK